MASKIVYQLILILIYSISSIQCSAGDQLPYYVDCLQYCFYYNCSSSTSLDEFNSKQSNLLLMIGWNCEEECNYNCQWSTIDYLLNEKNITRLPQFYGKWTFKRYFGLQEPASAICSFLNLIIYFISFYWYCINVIELVFTKSNHSKFKIKELFRLCFDKDFFLNGLNAIAAFNAWFWSTIFHCKDTQFTEVCLFKL